MIVFRKLTAKNFMSVGDNPVEVQLDSHKTTLITGGNGTGKSTILIEALTFGLFGRSFRGLNKPSLVNTVNQRDCVVSLVFTKNSDEYKIIRGIKPHIFQIEKNGQGLNESSSVKDFQQVLEDIIGFSYPEFTKTIALGNANYKPFLQLNAHERRTFIESLLGLTVFSEMNRLLKGRMAVSKDRIESLMSKLAVQKAIYTEKNEFLTHLKESNESSIAKRQSEIDEIQASIELKQSEIDNFIEYDIKTLKEDVDRNIVNIRDINSKISIIQNDIKKENKTYSLFLKPETDKCGTCFQKITEDFKLKTLDVTKTILEQLQDKLETAQLEYEHAMKAQTEISNRLTDAQSHSATKVVLGMELDQLKRRLAKIVEESDLVSETKIKEIEDVILECKSVIKTLATEVDEERENRKTLELASELLKDTGIKATVISKYIPMINKYINHYLDVLDFGVQCTLDEQFNDVMKGRFANEFVYANLSQGERTRIDLAILFALRQVAAVCSGAMNSILVLDEICDSSLDASGVDALFTIIEEACKEQNVFIISHRPDVSEKCHHSITLTKVGGFTKIL